MTFPRSPRAVFGASLAALTLTLAACGGDDDNASDADTTEATTASSGESTEATDTTDATDSTDAPTTSAAETATTAAGAPGATTGGSADAGPADRDAYVEAGVSSMGTYIGDAGDCVVEAVVDGFGVDALNEAGLTPETFWTPAAPLTDAGFTADSPEVEAVADGISSCDGLLDSFAESSGESVTDEQLSCMTDGGGAELIGQLLALSLVGADTTELDEEGQALGDECGVSS